MKENYANITVKDRIRIALALEILERKEHEQSVTACILSWQENRITKSINGTSTAAPKKQTTTDYERKLQVFARSLQDANKHFAKLEAEVKTLKRRLAVTEIDLEVKSKALNDAIEIPGAAAKQPPIKRRKKTADPLKDGNLHIGLSSQVNSDPPHTTAALASKVTGVSVHSLDQASSSNPVSGKAAANRKAKAKKVSYVNVGTSTEENLGAVDTYMHDPLNFGSQALYPNISEDFKLIQTLLLPPALLHATTQNREEHQTVLLDQALDVISQLTQAVKLAFSSATISQGVQPLDQQSVPCASASIRNTRLPVQDPVRMITLVTTIVEKFLPAILGRLEGSIAKGKVIFAVAKGVIKPAIGQISSAFSHPERLEEHQMPANTGVATQKKVLQTTKTLLERLLQVVPTYYLADQNGRPFKTSPFAEVIALWSDEALCSGIMSMKTASTSSITLGSSTLDSAKEARKPINNAIAALIELTGICLPLMHSSATSGYGSNDGISKNTTSSVATRICASITQLVAEIDVDVSSEIGAPPAAAKLDYTADGKEDDAHNHGPPNTDKQENTMSLWIHLGIDRGNMLAMCRLAEGLMIRESHGMGDEVYGGMYEWFESLVR